jgi:putative DNA primase/helicase
MRACPLHEPLAQVVLRRGPAPISAQRGAFTVTSSDRVDRGVGNLGSPMVQAEVECWLDGVELLIFDNLSSLTVGVRENDSDAWGEIQDWLLRLRRRGISVLIIHHAGKRGGQRGSADKFTQSAYADCYAGARTCSTPRSACASRATTRSSRGARFEVHIEKGRGLTGDHALPFEAQLELSDGKAAWSVKDVEDAVRIRVAALLAAGMTVREIAEEVGATKSAVPRMKQRIERAAREAREAEAGEAAGPGEGG